ncbi:hypothetical protein ACQ4PT_053287 [Festuca glaucescens]
MLSYKVLTHVDKVVEVSCPGHWDDCSPASSDSNLDGFRDGGDNGLVRATRRPPWRLGTPDARGAGSPRRNAGGQRTYCQVAASQPRSWRLPHMGNTPHRRETIEPALILNSVAQKEPCDLSLAHLVADKVAPLPAANPNGDTVQILGQQEAAPGTTPEPISEQLEKNPRGDTGPVGDVSGEQRSQEQSAIGERSDPVDSVGYSSPTAATVDLVHDSSLELQVSRDNATGAGAIGSEGGDTGFGTNLEDAFFAVSLSRGVELVRSWASPVCGPPPDLGLQPEGECDTLTLSSASLSPFESYTGPDSEMRMIRKSHAREGVAMEELEEEVMQMARKINSRREPGVLLKLDISRAFDSLSWSFLLEILQHMGFPEMCIRWIAIILRTATTRISVNGVPGKRIVHVRGLRQGDPQSPQLFVIAMEVVTLLICRATELGLLSRIGNCNNFQRLSIYADDVVLFIKPTVQDLVTVRETLRVFGRVSGLNVNYARLLQLSSEVGSR